MKLKDKRTKRPVEWEFRLYLDGNTWAKFISAGYASRSDALIKAKSHARYLLLSGQADEVEYFVDKMPSSSLPSSHFLFGLLTRDSIRG